ncbi:MAG: DegV family protein [Clostridia bacterium]|nr:DegV family protein [Clostridia bacterium]
MWHLVSDTSCDLFTLEGGEGQMDFSTIPFTIRIGNREYIDDENMSVEEMLAANESHAEMAQTSCPSPDEWVRRFSEPGPVVAFTISSALSGSYNSACLARTMCLEEDPSRQIAVIDTKGTGPEVAAAVLKARDLILAGASFDQVEQQLNRYVKETHIIFALASYHNLIKAGRVSRLVGFIAGHLGFWGVGIGDEKGEIAMRGRARGDRNMVRLLTEEIQKIGLAPDRVIRIHHALNEKDAQGLADRLKEAFSEARVTVWPTRGLDSFYAERRGLIVSF